MPGCLCEAQSAMREWGGWSPCQGPSPQYCDAPASPPPCSHPAHLKRVEQGTGTLFVSFYNQGN